MLRSFQARIGMPLAQAVLVAPILMAAMSAPAYSQGSGRSTSFQEDSGLTPFRAELKKQQSRLTLPDVEQRRDAVVHLGALHRPDSSRIAARALLDPAPIVRATAAEAVLSEPPEEAVAVLSPLLHDKIEFVRREVAYALGKTGTSTAVPLLIAALESDREASVRAAAAVALGEIRDAAAVSALAGVLTRRIPRSSGRFKRVRGETPENEFVRRAAARSLGEIRSRTAVPSLIIALLDTKTEEDVRREAAHSLGQIRDRAAVPALRAALTSPDPHLSRGAYEALRKVAPADATSPAHDGLNVP